MKVVMRCIYCTSAISTFETSTLKQVDLFDDDGWEQWQLSRDSWELAFVWQAMTSLEGTWQGQSIQSICKVWVSLASHLPTAVWLVWWGTGNSMEQQEQALKSHFCCLIADWHVTVRREKQELIQVAQQQAANFSPCRNKPIQKDQPQPCPGQVLLFAKFWACNNLYSLVQSWKLTVVQPFNFISELFRRHHMEGS